MAIHLALTTSLLAWTGWQSVKPVGHIESVYKEKFATPRQGSVAPDSMALLRLEKGLGRLGRQDEPSIDARAALDGLEEYSHVWLIWAAHLNGHDAKQAKVRAPKLRGSKAGLFATRAPYRPNPIGLSLVRLHKVDVASLTLQLSGVDLVSGTPIIDIKPYLPQYDAPLPEHGPVRTAAWVDPPPLRVRFDDAAEAALAKGVHSEDAAQFRRLLEQTLAADPRPLYRYKRALDGGDDGGEYDIAVDGWVARCRFEPAGAADGDGGNASDEEVVTVISLSADHEL